MAARAQGRLGARTGVSLLIRSSLEQSTQLAGSSICRYTVTPTAKSQRCLSAALARAAAGIFEELLVFTSEKGQSLIGSVEGKP